MTMRCFCAQSPELVRDKQNIPGNSYNYNYVLINDYQPVLSASSSSLFPSEVILTKLLYSLHTGILRCICWLYINISQFKTEKYGHGIYISMLFPFNLNTLLIYHITKRLSHDLEPCLLNLLLGLLKILSTNGNG